MKAGARNEAPLLTEPGTLRATVDPLIVTEQDKLIASDPASGDFFGWSVAVAGDTAVVGAPNEDDKGDEAGAKALWQRLRETVPEYAPKLDGK